MKKLLVPTDFSEPAEYALSFACDIAKKVDGELVLLHIVEYPSTYIYAAQTETEAMKDESMKRILEKAKEQLDKVISAQDFDRITLKHLQKIGNPFKRISSVIAEEQADMVIMGTGGISGLEDMLVGSNTEKVVRFASCPVISLAEATSLESIRNIVFPTNFEFNDRLAAELISWCNVSGATLHIVHINTPYNFESTKEINKRLNEFVERYEFRDFTIGIRSGITVEEGVNDYMEEKNGDMVAIATHSRRGLLHLFTGSIAEDVVNHMHKPVWTYSLKN